MTRARLADIAALVGGDLLGGDGAAEVSRIAGIETAGPDAISFVANPRYAKQLAATRAGCVIVAPALRDEALAHAGARSGAVIVCADPYLAYAKLSQWWAAQSRGIVVPGVHASAVVATGAQVHATASIGPFAFVASGARIGAHAVLGSHVHVGEGTVVGEGTTLKPHVTLSAGCRIGARGIVHSGAVVGADGFGFAPHEGTWVKIEQLGAVAIGNDVEIGANTCIDRGALEDTVLADGVKLDNLVQIGHNVRIGAHTAFAGCVGVAGSAVIGAFCTAGGGAIVLGHLEIVDHVHITAATVVSRSILKPGQYSGMFPFDDNASWEKNAATLRQLHTLRERVRALEKKN
jgi:UDP-3-O-[3-hydroxymyristoyl] glucosamine N-acyltransferase